MKMPLAARGLAFAAALLAGQPASAAEQCPTAKEQAALRTRALQTDFMVAALNCGERERYNDFVKTFKTPLVREGKALKAYFRRRHGERATRELNAFVTQLANLASRRYNARTRTFCTQAKTQLTEAMTLKPAAFADFVDRQPVELASLLALAKDKEACAAPAKAP